MNTDITNQLLQALLTATDERKQAALRVLCGEQANAEPEPERYLTLKQVASKLNFHPSTLWRWRVPKRNLGGRPRFLLSEVRAYVDSPEFQKKAKQLRLEREDQRKALAAQAAGGVS